MSARLGGKAVANEVRPKTPVAWKYRLGTFPYRVTDGDTWESLAPRFSTTPVYLIFVNFYVAPGTPHYAEQVNWYLREYVGCNVSKDGGRNWAFSNSAAPGVIYIPYPKVDPAPSAPDAPSAHSSKVDVEVKIDEYDDSDFLDTVSQALDIYGGVDLGLSVFGAAIMPELLAIGIGAATSVVGPLAAVGSGWRDAIVIKSRDYFFSGFALGFVMGISGWSTQSIREQHQMHDLPQESFLSDQRATFRNLYNAGLIIGGNKGRKLPEETRKSLKQYLRHQALSAAERHDYVGDPRDWSQRSRNDYYYSLAAAIKSNIMSNGLKLRIHE